MLMFVDFFNAYAIDIVTAYIATYVDVR